MTLAELFALCDKTGWTVSFTPGNHFSAYHIHADGSIHHITSNGARSILAWKETLLDAAKDCTLSIGAV